MDRYSGIAVLLELAMLVCPVHSIAQGRNDMLVVKYSY